MPLRTLLIDNYDSYTYNLYQLLGDVNGGARGLWAGAASIVFDVQRRQGCCKLNRRTEACCRLRRPLAACASLAAVHPAELPTVLRNDEADWPTVQARLKAGEFDNVVISPGPGTPQRASDIGEQARRRRLIPALACPALLCWSMQMGQVVAMNVGSTASRRRTHLPSLPIPRRRCQPGAAAGAAAHPHPGRVPGVPSAGTGARRRRAPRARACARQAQRRAAQRAPAV